MLLCYSITSVWGQARKSQVLRFGGAKYICRGVRFLFLLYILNKFSWARQICRALPLNAPVATGPVLGSAKQQG